VKLNTKYFGEIDYENDDILTFPKGLFAFEDENEFVLLPFEGSEQTLLCLQSTKTSQLAFVAMNPFALDDAYAPVLQQSEIELLEGKDSYDFAYYVLCVIKNPISESTVNFKCPVVVNEDTGKCMQVILDSNDYGMRHLLSDYKKTEG